MNIMMYKAIGQYRFEIHALTKDSKGVSEVEYSVELYGSNELAAAGADHADYAVVSREDFLAMLQLASAPGLP